MSARDMTEAQFRKALARNGFRMGHFSYVEITEGPCAGLHISMLNAGTDRLRSILAHLIAEKERNEKRKLAQQRAI